MNEFIALFVRLYCWLARVFDWRTDPKVCPDNPRVET